MTATTNPFELEGEWLRCALHTHSSESDGDLPPRALAAHYEAAGFDLLAISDHWRLTRVPSTKRLLTIPSAELSFDLGEGAGDVLVYGISEIPEDPGGDRRNWLVNEEEHWEQRTFPNLTAAGRFAQEQGGVAYLAHPYWTGLDPSVAVAADHVAGLEVFNGTGETETGRGDSSFTWDAVLESGKTAFGIATDDAHVPLFDIGIAWTWLRVPERSEEAAIHGLRTGALYASSGPEFRELRREGAVVVVACSPCRRIVLAMERERGCSVSAGRGGRQFGRILETNDDGLITRAAIESPWPDPRYVRVVAEDAEGRRAWTSPI